MKAMITHDREYYTVREAAEALRVSIPTVWRWVRSGQLQAYRVGKRSIRIRKGDLGAMTTPAEPPAPHASDLVNELRDLQAKILARRGGVPLPSSVPLIREARRERSERL